MSALTRGRRHGAAVAFSLLAILAVGGCASQTQLGGGSSMATGSSGVAGTQSASSQLARCDRPLGTAALVEPESYTLSVLSGYGLSSPVPVLRMLMAQSNCFRVVDRGAALSSIQTEDALAQSGMLKSGSTTARGRMVTTQYLLTPNVVFSNQDAGGLNALGALGGYFGGAGGLGGWASGIGGLAGISGYGNTAEGKLIVAALMDAHNKLVQQVRVTQPNLPPTQ